MGNIKNYSQLKSDIIALKEYIAELYSATTDISLFIDSVLTEMNDLLLGIEKGQIVMPYKQLRLASTSYATDGACGENTKLEKMIYQIQQDIYSIKKHIIVQQKPKLLFFKRNEPINWLFPNLDCKNGCIQCIGYQSEDILEITFSNGYGIDLGFIQNEYVITITKDDDWSDIIEEQHIKYRNAVEKSLQNFIYKYGNLR